jgi:hypothetical protein
MVTPKRCQHVEGFVIRKQTCGIVAPCQWGIFCRTQQQHKPIDVDSDTAVPKALELEREGQQRDVIAIVGVGIVRCGIHKRIRINHRRARQRRIRSVPHLYRWLELRIHLCLQCCIPYKPQPESNHHAQEHPHAHESPHCS